MSSDISGYFSADDDWEADDQYDDYNYEGDDDDYYVDVFEVAPKEELVDVLSGHPPACGCFGCYRARKNARLAA